MTFRHFLLLLAGALVLGACDPPRQAVDLPPPPAGNPTNVGNAGNLPAPTGAAPADAVMRMSVLKGLKDPSGQPISGQLLASRLLVVNFWSPY
jgi:hypothetical protein